MVSRGGEDCVRDATHKRIDTPRVKRMRHVDASKGTGYTVLSNFFSSFFPSLLSSIHSDRTDAGAYLSIESSRETDKTRTRETDTNEKGSIIQGWGMRNPLRGSK